MVKPLFNASRGSILLPLLFHWQLINPAFPDAAPHDTLFFVIATVGIVTIHRKKMFSREWSVTEVIPANKEARLE